MSDMVNVNFKLDAETKRGMEQACKDMGLSLSAAFTVFAKKVSREKRDRKSTRLNSSHRSQSRMPSSA